MPKQRKASKSRPKTKTKSKQIMKSKSEDSHVDSHQIKPKEVKRRKSDKKGQIKEQIKEQEKNKFELNLQAGVYTVKLHQTYTVKEDHPLYGQIKDLYALFVEKNSVISKKAHTHIPFTLFPTFEFHLKDEKPSHDKCAICQFEYQDIEDFKKELMTQSDEDIICLQCSHLLHKSCFDSLKGAKDWIKCPVCSAIFGIMTGDQPAGNMTWSTSPFMHCDGFDDVGTIVIDYSMHSCKKGSISYPGTHRTAYLPDNQKGNEVLALLKKAFDRKLIFTLGRSVTTGRDNQIVWNGIHHKTNTSGGSAYFGYPDQTYFDRVKLELAAKGVV